VGGRVCRGLHVVAETPSDPDRGQLVGVRPDPLTASLFRRRSPHQLLTGITGLAYRSKQPCLCDRADFTAGAPSGHIPGRDLATGSGPVGAGRNGVTGTWDPASVVAPALLLGGGCRGGRAALSCIYSVQERSLGLAGPPGLLDVIHESRISRCEIREFRDA
jgi:hypothetical protein